MGGLESDRGDLWRVDPWSELAIALARLGDSRADLAFDEAQLAAQEIGNDEVRNDALAKLAVILITEGRLEMAEGVIHMIKSRARRSQALTGLATANYRDNSPRAPELFILAERTAGEDWSGSPRDKALTGVVSGLAESGEFDEALRVASTIVGGDRITALCRLAEELVLAGHSRGQALLSEALEVANNRDAGTAWVEAQELRREAARLSRDQDAKAKDLWVRAQEIAGSFWVDRAWTNEHYCAEPILLLAIALARTGDPRADSTFELGHQKARTIPYDNPRDETLGKLVNGLIEVDRLEASERVSSDIRGDSQRLTAVRNLVNAYTTAGQLDSAVRVASSVPSEYYRREIMRTIAVAFARDNRMTEAIQVLEETTLDEFIGSIGCI